MYLHEVVQFLTLVWHCWSRKFSLSTHETCECESRLNLAKIASRFLSDLNPRASDYPSWNGTFDKYMCRFLLNVFWLPVARKAALLVQGIQTTLRSAGRCSVFWENGHHVQRATALLPAQHNIVWGWWYHCFFFFFFFFFTRLAQLWVWKKLGKGTQCLIEPTVHACSMFFFFSCFYVGPTPAVLSSM